MHTGGLGLMGKKQMVNGCVKIDACNTILTGVVIGLNEHASYTNPVLAYEVHLICL